jgi:hypothetical protein
MQKDITGRKKPMSKRKPAKVNAVVAEVEVTEDEAQLIADALGEISPGTQRSADFFNEKLPEGNPARVSRASVWNWANGVWRVDERRLKVWQFIHSPGDKRYDLALTILALRQREAENLGAHWVGEIPFKRASEDEIEEEDGKKLLKKVKVKK